MERKTIPGCAIRRSWVSYTFFAHFFAAALDGKIYSAPLVGSVAGLDVLDTVVVAAVSAIGIGTACDYGWSLDRHHHSAVEGGKGDRSGYATNGFQINAAALVVVAVV